MNLVQDETENLNTSIASKDWISGQKSSHKGKSDGFTGKFYQMFQK